MFAKEDYFDLKDFPFPELFSGVETCYGVLGAHLASFCAGFSGCRIEGKVMEGAILEGEGIFIGRGSVVEPGAYIKGPAIIGENTEIRHGAYLRGNVVAGNNCVIGHATEVKSSVFLNGAKAGHFAYVGDSVLGNQVNLGAGTKLANLKIVESGIVLVCGRERVKTGFRKMGAILGDRVETGCNSVTCPGLILAPGSLVFPAVAVRGAFCEKKVFKQSNIPV
jgi:NDP-sugar pyrophosphorylase family protein